MLLSTANCELSTQPHRVPCRAMAESVRRVPLHTKILIGLVAGALVGGTLNSVLGPKQPEPHLHHRADHQPGRAALSAPAAPPGRAARLLQPRRRRCGTGRSAAHRADRRQVARVHAGHFRDQRRDRPDPGEHHPPRRARESRGEPAPASGVQQGREGTRGERDQQRQVHRCPDAQGREDDRPDEHLLLRRTRDAGHARPDVLRAVPRHLPDHGAHGDRGSTRLRAGIRLRRGHGR